MADKSNIYDFSPAQGHGGSGGSGGGNISWRDYVDAQDKLTRAENSASFAEIRYGLAHIGDQFEIQKELLQTTKSAANEAKTAAEGAMAAATNTKWNIIATAIGVVGVLFAAWAIWGQGIEMVASILNSAGSISK